MKPAVNLPLDDPYSRAPGFGIGAHELITIQAVSTHTHPPPSRGWRLDHSNHPYPSLLIFKQMAFQERGLVGSGVSFRRLSNTAYEVGRIIELNSGRLELPPPRGIVSTTFSLLMLHSSGGKCPPIVGQLGAEHENSCGSGSSYL